MKKNIALFLLYYSTSFLFFNNILAQTSTITGEISIQQATILLKRIQNNVFNGVSYGEDMITYYQSFFECDTNWRLVSEVEVKTYFCTPESSKIKQIDSTYSLYFIGGNPPNLKCEKYFGTITRYYNCNQSNRMGGYKTNWDSNSKEGNDLLSLAQYSNNLFPNPVSSGSNLRIAIDGFGDLAKNVEVQVINTLGMIQRKHQMVLLNEISISTEGLVPGFYFVVINNQDERKTIHSFVVE